MKFILLFIFLSHAGAAQTLVQNERFDSLLAKGKAEFKKDFKDQDYALAASYMKRAVTLEPENAEAHYFLGYAYSRLNSKDGDSIIKMDLALNLKSSEEFEQVIQLTPKYTGEMVVLDPYSKITAQWGSMAMCYWYNNKLDSAVWALNEGKRRGGFGEFFLAINRSILNQCSKHAILVSPADNMTFSLLYLQLVYNYRTDVTVIDNGLLNASWYPKFLKSKLHVTFDQPEKIMDTLEFLPWKDSIVSIRNKYAFKDFSWKVKTTVYEDYLRRNQVLLIGILKANEFESDVYFTAGTSADDLLSLDDYLINMILLKKINVKDEQQYSYEEYKRKITEAFKLIKSINMNSQIEVDFVDNLRYNLLINLEEQNQKGNRKEVKYLVRLLDTYTPESKFPYWAEEIKKFVNHMRKQY